MVKSSLSPILTLTLSGISVWLLSPTGELMVNDPSPLVWPTVKFVARPVAILASTASRLLMSALLLTVTTPVALILSNLAVSRTSSLSLGASVLIPIFWLASTRHASTLSVLATIVPSVPLSVRAIDVSPFWNASSWIVVAVKIPRTLTSPVILISPAPAGSMLISPVVDSMLLPAIWILPNVPLVGVTWLLLPEESEIVKLDSACRLVTCCENATVPFSWST